MSADAVAINGWSIYAHPLFLDQFEALVAEVGRAAKKDPVGYRGKRPAKLLAAVLKVAFDDIPENPARAVYRQGATLGERHKHWFRAKFLQQYRLFFRYSETASGKVVVLAWMNDAGTLRAYGSADDAYATFRKMLDRGNPPDDLETLLAQAKSDAAAKRLKTAISGNLR